MKLERTTKETIIIVILAILAVLAIVRIMWTHDTAAAAVTGQLSTGECGYYQNQGTLHRNGLVTPDHCTRPYKVVEVTRYEGFAKIAAEQPAEASYAANSPIVDNSDKPVTEPVITDKPVVDNDKPVKVDDGSKPDKKNKKHCNNGNGNGGEGCNASDRGNNDETGDKGNKADERDNGNSDHGKGNDKK